MYMLDTNAFIMSVRHPDWSIYRKIRAHLGKDLCISTITLGELEYGISKSISPVKNRMAVYSLLAGIQVVDFDATAARHFGDIFADLEKRIMRISDRDTQIAAHARSRGDVLITNNTREFSRVKGLAIEEWKVDITTGSLV